MRPLPAVLLALALPLLATGCDAPERVGDTSPAEASAASAAAPAAPATKPTPVPRARDSSTASPRSARSISSHETAVTASGTEATMRSRGAAADAPPAPRPKKSPAATRPPGPTLEEPPIETTRAGVAKVAPPVETAPPVAPATEPTAAPSDARTEPVADAAPAAEPTPDPVPPEPTPVRHDPEIEPLAPGTPPELGATRGVARPTGPVEVRVRAAESHGALALQLLDRTGRAIETVTVAPGSVDLLPLAPGLAKSTETIWVQLLEDGRAIGAPLWITPLRAAPPVRTVRSIRASNQQPYQRVVGWGDRALDPNDAETAATMPTWSPADPVVTAGYRVEPAVEALMHTSDGDMRVGFAPDAAPATVENFLRLARSGFYDGTIFHRVVPLDREGRPFVVQGGDPTGTGDGGPGWNLALEPSDLKHDRGVLGMARGDDPHSAGSQFYISLSREGTARLDAQYCTFAFMLEGFDTLDRIAQSEIGDAATGRPRTPPRIERMELVPARPCAAGSDPHARPSAPEPAAAVSPAPTGER